MWKAEVMRSETTGFACGKHSLSFRMWRQHRGTSFRLWKREGQPRGTDESIRIGKRKREPSPPGSPARKIKKQDYTNSSTRTSTSETRPACETKHTGFELKRKPFADDKAGTNRQLNLLHKRNEGRGEGRIFHKRNEAQSKLPGKYQKRSEHLTIHKLLPGRELRLSADRGYARSHRQTIICKLPVSQNQSVKCAQRM